MRSDFKKFLFCTEKKILLAKGGFMYYLVLCKELRIVSRACRPLLLIFLLSITFQSNAFAGIKEKSVDQYRAQGFDAQQRGNFQEALSFYAKAASLAKDNEAAPILNDAGVVYEQMGFADKAEESYLQALQLNDHYLPACSNLAYFYKRQGEPQKAAEYFKKRVEWGDPGDIWTGKAKEELSDIARNSPKIRKWLTQHEAKELTGEIAKKEREDFVSRIIESDEHFKKGNDLLKVKKYTQAVEEYNQAAQLTPNNPKVTKARNEALMQSVKKDVKESSDAALKMLDMGDVVSAKVEFRKILTIIPDEPIQELK